MCGKTAKVSKMNTATTTNSYGAPRSGLMDRVKIYLVREKATRHLHGLDDRLLADVGLNRSQINASMWGR
jgi:uncharacterized protein YjiS (DUF1127 family)